VTDDSKRTTRGIDLTIDIDATLEEVWQALTTGEGIARWFAPYAAVTPGEGGSVSVGWDPNEMWEQPITVWEPQRRMQTASEMPSKDGRMVRLAVDYYVEVHGGRVRVRLVHSGFDDSSWDDYIDGLDAGWTFFLFNLKHALERHRGVARVQQSARFRTTARAGEDHPVFGAKGLRLQPPIGGLRSGDACRLSLGGAEVDATVAVRHPSSRTIAFVVPAWNDALLFVEREGMKETHHLGVWLSLYGVPETTAAPLRQGLADLQSALSVPKE
jgi:uncharacterized protein YndB with AHSA1/START domain